MPTQIPEKPVPVIRIEKSLFVAIRTV